MSRNKKLTNKQVEHHLNNLYSAITKESNTLSTTMQVMTDYIEFSKNTKDFQEYIMKKYKKEETEKKDTEEKKNSSK